MHDKFLSYFDEVARQGSIRKAAAHLNVSSSSVNRKIIAIENLLGVRLFDRHPDGVELTPAGSVVLEHCRKTIFDYRNVLSAVADIRELRSGNITIATLDSVATTILPDALSEFAQSFPQISLVIRMAHPAEVARSVAEGETDIGISFSTELLPGVRIHTEKATPIGAIMRSDHPLAGRDALEIEDFEPFRLIRSYDGLDQHSLWDEAVGSHKINVPTQVFTNSLPLARTMIERTHGIGIYTKIGFLDEIEDGSLAYVPIRRPNLSKLKIGILVSSRHGLAQSNFLMCNHLARHLKALRLDS